MSPNDIEELKKIRDMAKELYFEFDAEDFNSLAVMRSVEKFINHTAHVVSNMLDEPQVPALFKPLQGG